mmetsp:Transcript_2829/g.5308  ORF Transcript_2829/g.5308 Transcript_2829/m.5308 type:complete len:234 (+) Transcript_2829:874-1575(+)
MCGFLIQDAHHFILFAVLSQIAMKLFEFRINLWFDTWPMMIRIDWRTQIDWIRAAFVNINLLFNIVAKQDTFTVGQFLFAFHFAIAPFLDPWFLIHEWRTRTRLEKRMRTIRKHTNIFSDLVDIVINEFRQFALQVWQINLALTILMNKLLLFVGEKLPRSDPCAYVGQFRWRVLGRMWLARFTLWFCLFRRMNQLTANHRLTHALISFSVNRGLLKFIIEFSGQVRVGIDQR